MRTIRIEVRLSGSEKKFLEELSEENGISKADIVRKLIRTKYEERFPQFVIKEFGVKSGDDT